MSNILLIETDKLLAQNIQQILEAQGHSVDWQVEPQEAITRADTTKPDLVILDLILAERSGIEFLYEFRSYPDWQALPAIIFTNIPAEELQACAEGFSQLNVVEVLYKPTTSLKKLANTVDQALKTALV
ncbi:MAG: response regulator [Candidatus Saccharimonadales bacterium]